MSHRYDNVNVADFAAWRTTARDLLRRGIPPEGVTWQAAESRQPSLPLGRPAIAIPPGSSESALTVPRQFLRWAELVAAHRSDQRWSLLYRVLWRLTHGEPTLLDITIDDDVDRLLKMARQVRGDVHRMNAFVRFRVCGPADLPHYLAWYQPDHRIVPLASPFFAERFAAMRWAILTPDASVCWNGDEMRLGPGVPKPGNLGGDLLESLWRRYYEATFSPDRVNRRLLDREMPGRFRANLPESASIDALLARGIAARKPHQR